MNIKSKNKIKYSWYTSPILFATIITLLLALFNTSVFNPYRIDVRLLPKQRENHNVYDNVNQDEFYESITFDISTNTNLHYIEVSKEKTYLKENYTVGFAETYVADCDNDGRAEIFFFSKNLDSLFLNTYNVSNKELHYKYIGKCVNKYRSNRTVDFIGAVDANGDGYKEIFFFVNGKFRDNVRSIYRYDIHNNILKESPRISSLIINAYIHNNEGSEEIVYSTWGLRKTIGYTNDDDLPYIKASVHVLDLDFNEKIKPIQYDGVNKSVGCLNIKKDKKDYLCVFVDCVDKNDTILSNITLIESYDYKGNKINSQFIDYDIFVLKNAFFTLDDGDESEIYVSLRQGGILKLDNNLNIIKRIKIEKLETPILAYKGDIDLDGEDELLFHDNFRKYNAITKQDFSKPIIFERPKPYDLIEGVYSIGKLRYNKHNSIGHAYSRIMNENLYIESRYLTMYINYYKADDYLNVYLYFLIIFCSIFILVWIIRYLVARNIRSKYEIMNRIAELRYQNVSNQMSPHFTMNAMNSIASLIYKEEKEKAYDFLSKLAKLMKMSLLDSGRTSRTLKSELEFVKAFLDIQKLRFKDKFTYSIEKDSYLADNLPIMPFLVQTFVENAIKHGLKNIESGGKISVSTKTVINGVFIYIEDNGIGRKAAALNKKYIESTGKGIALSNEYIKIINKKDNRKMKIDIIDLKENNKGTGTRVEIFIDFVENSDL